MSSIRGGSRVVVAVVVVVVVGGGGGGGVHVLVVAVDYKTVDDLGGRRKRIVLCRVSFQVS